MVVELLDDSIPPRLGRWNEPEIDPGMMKKRFMQPPSIDPLFVPFYPRRQKLLFSLLEQIGRYFSCTSQERFLWKLFPWLFEQQPLSFWKPLQQRSTKDQ